MTTEASQSRKKVLACVIERDSSFLVCKRPGHKHHGGLWEFPGGKMEQGESFKDTAIRELKEELGLKVVSVGKLLFSIVDQSIDLEICFVSVAVEGKLILYEHDSYSWASVIELNSLPLAPSDKSFLQTLG